MQDDLLSPKTQHLGLNPTQFLSALKLRCTTPEKDDETTLACVEMMTLGKQS